MSWSQWPQPAGTVGSWPGTAVAASAPALGTIPAVPTAGAPYSAEQWAAMQQQNWQQWVQWQQQYQQWQQQYGEQYQKSLALTGQSGVSLMPVQPPLPMTDLKVAPPLPETRPPLPPEEPPKMAPSVMPQQAVTYNANIPPPNMSLQSNVPPPNMPLQSNLPPPPPPQGSQQQPMNFGQNRFCNTSQPPPSLMNLSVTKPQFNDNQARNQNFRSDFGSKRSSELNNDHFDDAKKIRWEANAEKREQKSWSSNMPAQRNQWQGNKQTTRPNAEELSEAEKNFDKQFEQWEAQFNKWKEQNVGHPDKQQYKEYEAKWESWRSQLLDRREQMRKKRLGLTNTPTQSTPTKPDIPTTIPLANNQTATQTAKNDSVTNIISESVQQEKTNDKLVETKIENIENPTAPEADIAFLFSQPPKEQRTNIRPRRASVKSDTDSISADTSFLKSSEAKDGGIPGLDLVKDDDSKLPDNKEEKKSEPDLKVPDLEAISKGINSILGDQKLMNMLSIVAQNKKIDSANTDFQNSFNKPDLNNPVQNDFNNSFNQNFSNDDYKHNRDNFEDFTEDVQCFTESNKFVSPGSNFNEFNQPNYNATSQKPENKNFERDSSHMQDISNIDFTKLPPNRNNQFEPPNNFGPNRHPNNFAPNSAPMNRGPNEFGPMKRGPNNVGDFGQMNKPCNDFGAFNKNPNDFGSFGRNSNNFGPGNRNLDPQNRGPNDFGPPNRGPNDFGPPNRGPNDFGPPNRGPNDFGPPNRGPNDFGPPNRGPNDFGTPNRGPNDFGPPNRGPNDFGPPNKGLNFNASRRDSNDFRDPNEFRPHNNPNDFNFSNRGSNDFGQNNRPYNEFDPLNKNNNNFNSDNRRPNNFGPSNRTSGEFNAEQFNNFNKPPGNFNQNFQNREPNFNRGPNNFNTSAPFRNNQPLKCGGSDNFNKGPFPRGFNQDQQNRGPDNFRQSPLMKESSFCHDPENEQDDFNPESNFPLNKSNFNQNWEPPNRGYADNNRSSINRPGSNETWNSSNVANDQDQGYDEGQNEENQEMQTNFENENKNNFPGSQDCSSHPEQKQFAKWVDNKPIPDLSQFPNNRRSNSDFLRGSNDQYWDEALILKPVTVVDYGHKSLNKPEINFVEPVHTFDYGHTSEKANKKIVDKQPLREPLYNKYNRYSDPELKFNRNNPPKVSNREDNTVFRRKSYEKFDKLAPKPNRPVNKYFGEPNRYENKDSYEEEKFNRESSIEREKQQFTKKPKVDDNLNLPLSKVEEKSSVTMIEDLLVPPGRNSRPPRIVIILRGPPGSGKTFLAKLIKDKEVEQGGCAPRILALDDYFMVEQDKEIFDKESGRKTIVKEMVYEYEECMELSYRQSLEKAFKKTITDGFFPFIILDCVNDKTKHFADMWSFAKQNGFQVYICQMELEVASCTKRNIHYRSEIEIERLVAGWEPTPKHYLTLDATSLIQAGCISEVEMEEVENADEVDQDEDKIEGHVISKWERMEHSGEKLARLDGISKPLRPRATMEDYLQLEDDIPEGKPGRKRVRWADLEERRRQDKIRAIGFVVGQTDWDRMMDPTQGSSALTQTKYIERVRRF